jgi:hypothetical protein
MAGDQRPPSRHDQALPEIRLPAFLGDFCTSSIEAYVDLAVAWTKDELAALRAGLRQRVAASLLCDHVRFGGNLDAALRHLWQGWCSLKTVQTAPATS